MTCWLRWCVKMETRYRIPIWRTFGRIQWHEGHVRATYHIAGYVLPLGEFTVTIPEPHATLQGAVTWRNQCRDRAKLQGVRIPSLYWKSFFAIFFLFLMQFTCRLWRAAAFVSSPIHLFVLYCNIVLYSVHWSETTGYNCCIISCYNSSSLTNRDIRYIVVSRPIQ